MEQNCQYFENLVQFWSIYFKILDLSVSRWNHFIAKCKQSFNLFEVPNVPACKMQIKQGILLYL
jgi:hypothetical protein